MIAKGDIEKTKACIESGNFAEAFEILNNLPLKGALKSAFNNLRDTFIWGKESHDFYHRVMLFIQKVIEEIGISNIDIETKFASTDIELLSNEKNETRLQENQQLKINPNIDIEKLLKYIQLESESKNIYYAIIIGIIMNVALKNSKENTEGKIYNFNINFHDNSNDQNAKHIMFELINFIKPGEGKEEETKYKKPFYFLVIFLAFFIFTFLLFYSSPENPIKRFGIINNFNDILFFLSIILISVIFYHFSLKKHENQN